MSATDSMVVLPGYDEALARVLAHVPELGTELVPLSLAAGRVLRAEVKADRDQPPFHRSAMDGFAVISPRISMDQWHEVTGVVAAGGAPLAQGQGRSGVIRIATGAPVALSFDAVIPIEQAQVETQGEAERVRFHAAVLRPGQHIHKQGADAKGGDRVLPAGIRLSPQHIGIAAAVGAVKLTVSQLPRITLLTTGDEVVDPATVTAALGPQQIRNSNGPLLTAFFAALGTPLLEHVHVCDDPEQTRAAAREALSRSHLVITNGGISAGQRDWLPWAWNKLGMNTVIQGVAIQPGKPVLVCSDEITSDSPSKLVLGLPGNPVSVLATAHLFAWPVIRLMLSSDAAQAALPWRSVVLREATKANSRRQVFRAAQLERDGSARVIGWHGSGDLMHTAMADGFVRLPLTDEPIAAGTLVEFLPMVRA